MSDDETKETLEDRLKSFLTEFDAELEKIIKRTKLKKTPLYKVLKHDIKTGDEG